MVWQFNSILFLTSSVTQMTLYLSKVVDMQASGRAEEQVEGFWQFGQWGRDIKLWRDCLKFS